MSPTHMIDTYVLGQAIRRADEAVNERFRAALRERTLAISAITLGEMRFALAKLRAGSAYRHTFDALLPLLCVLAWDEAAANAFGTIRAEQDREMVSEGELGAQVAAHALACDLTLVVRHTDHFSHIPRLRVESWARG